MCGNDCLRLQVKEEDLEMFHNSKWIKKRIKNIKDEVFCNKFGKIALAVWWSKVARPLDLLFKISYNNISPSVLILF